MSIRLMSDVFRRVHGMPSGRRMLLVVLADFANDEGVCWPSIKSLALNADLGERHVSAELKELMRAGFLAIEEVAGKSNVYRLSIERGVNHSSPQGMNHSSGVNHSSSRTTVQGGDEPQATPTPAPQAITTTLNPHKTISEPSRRAQAFAQPRAMTYPPAFEEFWEAYPKKKSKGDAFKAWKQLRPDADLRAHMLRSVEQLSRSDDWRKESGKYVPYPASWIRAEGWLDVVEVKVERMRTMQAFP